MSEKKKIIRAATVPGSLRAFCGNLLRELSADYEVVALSSPGKDLDAVAENEGVRAIAVPMERHISPLKDLRSLFRLIKVFRRERPWMVHSMTPKAGLLCMLAARITGVPRRVHTFTGLIWPTSTGLKRRILVLTDKILCHCATHIIPEGNGVRLDLFNGGITKKPMQVLAFGNVRGIDLSHYDCTEDVMRKSKEIRKEKVFTYIFIGRLVRDKGIHELIEAFVRLNSERENTRLILVGEAEPDLDPLSKDDQRIIKTHDAIEAVGRQADVRPWLCASNALAFPSYREGFPNVVIEAGAMGLPSIVTDINGSNEIIVNGENGIIVPPCDADALYQAMLEMIDDRVSREAMSAKARKMVADRFDSKIVRKALFDFYASL